ncbi:hypothetical protein TNCV_4226901 [Trichonephila clavipes]|nr:hypothetical protein TNCV_4226901 [Trichonephila clavipes]
MMDENNEMALANSNEEKFEANEPIECLLSQCHRPITKGSYRQHQDIPERTNENKMGGERQRASASAQNEWGRVSEADMRRVPRNGEGREST